MPLTLLTGSATGVWRDWLKQNLGDRPFLSLDPAAADFGLPARYALYQSGRVRGWRFAGTLDPMRAPHVLLAAAQALLPLAGEGAVIETPPFRPGPLRQQVLRLLVEAVRPGEWLIDPKAHVPPHGWPIAPQPDEPAEPLPPSVLAGHRKARWLQMLEDGEPHEIDLRKVAVSGARLGSGIPVPLENLKRWGFADPKHAESAGSTLLAVSDAEVGDVEISRALDAVHANKAVVVSGRSYEGLLGAFSREDGEDFAMGTVQALEFPILKIQATAVPPSNPAVLKLGSLRLGPEGQELGETKVWEV